MKTGLVSITFRKLSVREIVGLVAKAGLEGIEWGGDIHVKHGDLAAAEAAARMTRDAGLAVSSYGSYYRAPESESEGLPFRAVLDTALALGAPTIRVWSGSKGSADADEAYRAEVVAGLRRVADMAGEEGVGIACEFHGGSLSDNNDSAAALMAEADHANVGQYWQPAGREPFDYCSRGLQLLLPHLANLHVFHWVFAEGGLDRRPLAEGESVWHEYLRLAATTGRDHWALLEFVREESPEQFMEDAATLRTWISKGEQV